jgi:hypothetical protein
MHELKTLSGLVRTNADIADSNINKQQEFYSLPKR